MTRPFGMPETPRGRKGWKQNSNGKPNNWATNSFPSNPKLHNQLVQGEGSSLEATPDNNICAPTSFYRAPEYQGHLPLSRRNNGITAGVYVSRCATSRRQRTFSAA